MIDLTPNYDEKAHFLQVVFDAVQSNFPKLAFSLAFKEDILYVNWETNTGFHELCLVELTKESLRELVIKIYESN